MGTVVEGRGVGDTSIGRCFFRSVTMARQCSRSLPTSGGFTGVNLVAAGRAEYVQQQRVSTGFFRVLGVAPQVGREFDAGPAPAGGCCPLEDSACLARASAATGGVVARTALEADIVGVMPPGFHGLFRADVGRPFARRRRTQAGDDEVVVAAAFASRRRAKGRPDVGAEEAVEARRHDAHDGVRLASEQHRPPHHPAVAAEHTPPHAVAQEDGGRPAGAILVRVELTSDLRSHAQHAEEPRRDALLLHVTRHVPPPRDSRP